MLRKLWFIHSDSIEKGEIEFNHCGRVFSVVYHQDRAVIDFFVMARLLQGWTWRRIIHFPIGNTCYTHQKGRRKRSG